VAVVDSRTNGNTQTGVRVRDTTGSVLVRDVTSSSGLEEGIKIDTDGPVTISGCTVDGNAFEAVLVSSRDSDVTQALITRNHLTNNSATAVVFDGLGGPGTFEVRCNDIDGNDSGLYLPDPVTVDARRNWWGDVSGPGGQGPGTGDGVFAELGATIEITPWLLQPFVGDGTLCEFFGSGFESGLLEEWDLVVE
jgi:hypothetical protein